MICQHVPQAPTAADICRRPGHQGERTPSETRSVTSRARVSPAQGRRTPGRALFNGEAAAPSSYRRQQRILNAALEHAAQPLRVGVLRPVRQRLARGRAPGFDIGPAIEGQPLGHGAPCRRRVNTARRPGRPTRASNPAHGRRRRGRCRGPPRSGSSSRLRSRPGCCSPGGGVRSRGGTRRGTA